MYDLVLAGGHVVDPAAGLDAVRDVAFADGRVAAVEPSIDPDAAKTVRRVDGAIVTPGLIDLHTHVYWGATSLSVAAEPIARRSGATTFVDAGSAGAGTIDGFRAFIVEATPLRILAFLNISYAGIFGFSRTVMVGECEDLRLLDAKECLRLAEANRDLVVGIKVRCGRVAGGNSGLAPLDLALEVAGRLDLPVMAHIDFPPPSRRDVLERLRPGDILTHCFRPFPNAPSDGRGRLARDILAARERGILFDIGHGMGGFAFAEARAALAAGVAPDTISSDAHVLCADGPAYDVCETLSKFLALGMPLAEVVRGATAAPAAAIGRPEIGTLAPGTPGDATVLDLVEGPACFTDAAGETLEADHRLRPRLSVVAGGIWHDAAPAEETAR
ncbi:MAG: amidohydrolase/deacetylase family metallohydrolase [Azospirillaceae bacterium]